MMRKTVTMMTAALLLGSLLIGCSSEEAAVDKPEKKIGLNNMPIQYELPGMDKVKVKKDITYQQVAGQDWKMDVYYPDKMKKDELRPAVIFVHGQAEPAALKDAKDFAQYVSWGQATAKSGMVAVTFNHRSNENLTKIMDTQHDIETAIQYVRDHAAELNIDRDNLVLWGGSGGPQTIVRMALTNPQPYVKGIIAYYGQLDLPEQYQEYSPLKLLKEKDPNTKLPPLFLVKAGRDGEILNRDHDNFVQEALRQNLDLELHVHPTGPHVFDILADDEKTHEIIERTFEFAKERLGVK
ncbi:hypothetical protein CBW65_12560 [Tumebacillus avium]|uniref:BD-FAE-like domain-containing protein n=1 Tax=Tumebacillus avium TaxID=1903704 RepID=A0A1Y0IQY8_9BACL|nr:alpha/beta hydrolase [Tumebacillus avium]ARU61764.1 hypothetical protein CBW65_12560 [Tumebacillus avium]